MDDSEVGRRTASGFADGGLITGPGTGRSDSIPAMVSNRRVHRERRGHGTAPFETISLRVARIDTPESRRDRAKCAVEIEKGLRAKKEAALMTKPGERIQFAFHGFDKYGGRILASVTLPDGRDFTAAMIAAGHARAYDGKRKGS